MEKLFYPRNVAVIGVSENPNNAARCIVQGLITWNYQGEIYGVHPEGGEVFGKKIYKSLKDIPEKIDLAVILSSAKTIPSIIEECGKNDIHWVSISSGGFGEYNEEGENLGNIIKEKAKSYNIRFVGPNCLGVMNGENGLCVSFSTIDKIPSGNISILSQSGGLGLGLLLNLIEERLGLSKFVSMGNKLDLDEVDYLTYLKDDKNTKVIVIFLEHIERGKEFIEILSKIDKPILVYKANTSKIGAITSKSHTGAILNDDKVIDIALKKGGAIRVDELSKLIRLAKVFTLPKMKGNKIFSVSHAGGYAVISADHGEKNGFEFPPLEKEIEEKIKKHRIAGVVRLTNPLDLGDVLDSDATFMSIERLMESDKIDGGIFIAIRRKDNQYDGFFKRMEKNIIPELDNLIEKYKKPLVVSLFAPKEVIEETKEKSKIPIYPSIEEALYALSLLRDYPLKKEKKREVLHDEMKNNSYKIDKIDNIYNLLKLYNIPFPEFKIVSSEEEFLRNISKIGFPLTIKIFSKEILHKTEIGGVFLNIKNENEAISVYRNIVSKFNKDSNIKIEGVMLQKFISQGYEIIIGMKRDKNFGPVILFGLGGIYVEILKDISLGITPIDRGEAEEMINKVKSSKILKGFRSGKKVDINLIIDMICNLSKLSEDFPQIKELELNPIIVSEKEAQVVDVRVVIDN